MGGSASGNSNAQLFQLLSQYGGQDSGSGGKSSPYSGMKPGDAVQLAAQRMAKAGSRNPGSVTSPLPLLMAYTAAKKSGGGAITNTTTPGTTTPGGTANPPPAQMYWQFPQYTQSWAFTPPAPTPYEYPQPFDTSKYGNPLNPKNVKKNR